MIDIPSPLGWVGQEFAKLDISDYSNQLIDARIEEKKQKHAVHQVDPGGLVTGFATNLAANAVPLAGVASGFVNPFGWVVSFGDGGGDRQSEHKLLIEDLSLNSPGFIHQTMMINRKEVEVWIDASGVAEGDNTPTIYIEGAGDVLGNPEDRFAYRNHQEALRQAVAKLSDKAVTQVQEDMQSRQTANAKLRVTLNEGNGIQDANSNIAPSTSQPYLKAASEAAGPAKNNISAGSSVAEAGDSCVSNAKGACVTPDRSH